MTKFILLDIEGTCSDIDFVRNVLFPYSAKKLESFLSQNRNHPKVNEALTALNAPNAEAQISQLHQMIRDDVKHPSLKTLQGMIWKTGFESGEFKSPLYPDVVPALKRWKNQNLSLGIYSSGSVPAQKLFWGHTEAGNLLDYFTDFFDLDIGSKKEASSYQKIAQRLQLQLQPQQILFLSDSPEEILAAQKAGLRALQIIRDGVLIPGSAPDFTKIN